MKKDKEWLRNEINYLQRSVALNRAFDDIIELIDQLDEPELPVVHQFVADWYDKNKDDLENNIDALIRNSRDGKCRPIVKWMFDKTNKPIGTLIKMKDGYTIEPPKTLQVTVKNDCNTVYKTELPEDVAMKLIEEWKKDVE